MLARLGDFAVGSGIARRWRRYERREDGTRRYAAGRRFLTHFIRPFSIARLRRRAGGIWISFSSLARLASCLFTLIRICVARIVSVPWKRCGEGVVAWGDTPRLVGGGILASRPSSRPLVSFCGPFDFPRIGLRAGCGAPFLSAHSPASFVGGRADRFLFRLVSRLACSSRVASRAILCGSLANPFHLVDLPTSRRSVFRFVFSSRSAVRFSSRSSSRPASR